MKTKNNLYNGFTVDNSKIMLAIIFLLIGLIVSVVYIKLLFMANRKNFKFNFLTTAENANQIIFAMILLFLIAAQLTQVYNYEFTSLTFIIFSVIFYQVLQVYRNSKTKVMIEKFDKTINITSFTFAPLINFAPPWFIQKHPIFSSSSDNLNLAIVPMTRSSRSVDLQINNKILYRYSFMSLDEALKYSKTKNEFVCLLVNKKIEFEKGFGIMIGYYLSIEVIQQILQFIDKFAPVKIVKLENISKNDFEKAYQSKTNFLQNLTGKKKVLVVFLLGLFILLYFLGIIFAVILFYLLVSVPDLNLKENLGIILIVITTVLVFPIFLWFKHKNRKEKETLVKN